MSVRIWLEVGHSCGPRSTPRGHAKVFDWRLWVRGANGRDISAFVHKVVFILRPSSAFVYPKRVLPEPPYEIEETGSMSLDIPIDVYLKHSKQKKIRLRYSLVIEDDTKSTDKSQCVSINVEKPSKLLWKALIAAGGEAVEQTNRKHRSDRLVITPETHSGPPLSRYQLVEPVQCKHVLRSPSPYALEDTCIKCGESQIELKKELRMANMTEDEIDHAAQLYVSFSDYEKHLDAITLPPFSDPIFNIPELPASLQEMLKNAEIEKPEL
ncbi:unnamed protein product [Diatraea saccharalis]|uniref:YEATS domain-containing protein n=1 Tax=Diatraea saccharalis TaxID=40085 RepID=A0A9N9R7X4_9NEOP|nr:unnamed protein product [Diatraea saccharalis]